MTTPVLCGVRGPSEATVVRALEGTGSFTVVRRCADLAEVLAGSAAGLAPVAILGPRLPGLDGITVAELHAAGVWVVALVESDAEAAAARGATCDAVVAVSGDLVPEVLGALEAVVDALAEGGRPGQRPGAPAPAAVTAAPAPSVGGLVAVWGPTGAPGRTTVAVNLAAELAEATAEAGRGALLVDADTYGGAVAQALGLLDEAAGLVAATRAAGNGTLDAAALAALAPVLPGGLRVLTGITRPERWPEIPGAALERLWPAARRLAGITVVDCGFGVEADEALSYDTSAPQRNATTLAALAEADQVVVVGAGDPIGLQRLVGALARLPDLAPTAARHVVVNRVRASAVGPAPEEAVRSALHRYAGVEQVHVVPDDREALDHAVLTARTLAEAAPGSPARRAIAALAATVASLSIAAPAGAH